MMSLWFQSFLLPTGWSERVRLEIAHGRIRAVIVNVAPEPASECHMIGMPGLPNLHCHAFQRGMAGLAEVPHSAGDSFWTWRDTMYRFVDAIGRDDIVDGEVHPAERSSGSSAQKGLVGGRNGLAFVHADPLA